MTNLQNSNYLLTESDAKLTAMHLGYSERQVRLVKNGKRGKRNTLVQSQIKKALEYRSLQNRKFAEFCNKLKEKNEKRERS